MGIALVISITLFVLSTGMNIRQFDLYKSLSLEDKEKSERLAHQKSQITILSGSLTKQAEHLKELQEAKEKLSVYEAQKTAVEGLIKKYEGENHA